MCVCVCVSCVSTSETMCKCKCIASIIISKIIIITKIWRSISIVRRTKMKEKNKIGDDDEDEVEEDVVKRSMQKVIHIYMSTSCRHPMKSILVRCRWCRWYCCPKRTSRVPFALIAIYIHFHFSSSLNLPRVLLRMASFFSSQKKTICTHTDTMHTGSKARNGGVRTN